MWLLGKAPLKAACQATQAQFAAHGPVPVRVEIHNISNHELELLAVGIPWLAFSAIEFQVRNVRGFRARLPEAPPRSLPPVPVPAGGTVSGEVDLRDYLIAGRETIADRPGSYLIEATVRIFLAEKSSELLKLRCEPFPVRISKS